jgi:hypothetical protein
MDCCSCVSTNIDGAKSGGVCLGVVSCVAVAAEYGIPYCDCWTGPDPGMDPPGEEADSDGQGQSPPDTADRDESGEGVSFGGLLAGDLMTPPFVPPNAERS